MAEKIVEVDGKRYMKVQKGKYFNKKKNRKMKRHHLVRWILISCFCLLIVAPVGFIFGAFYDTNSKDVNDTSEKFSENFTNALSKSLTNIASTNKLTLELDNDFLDSTLVVAQEKLISDPTISNFIKKIYCNINENEYDFVVDVQLSFFKTRIHLKTVLKYDESSQTYIFKIENVILGRLPLGNLAKKILPQFISEDQIKTAINAIFKNCNFSLSNMEITYKKEDLKNDLGDILNSIDLDILDSPLSSVLLSLYNNIDSSATFKEKITIVMDFTKFKDAQIVSRNGIGNKFKENIKTHATEVAQLLKDNLLTSEESGTIFKFFLTGYSDEAKTIFDSKDNLRIKCEEYLTSIEKTTTTVANYKGDKEYRDNKKDKDDISITGLPSTFSYNDFIGGTDIAQISESELSKFMRSNGMMGYTFAMPLQVEDKYVFNYVTFDDFSVNINEGSLDILGDINLNGMCLPLSIECSVNFPTETTTNRTMFISPENIYISVIPLSAETKATMLDYIAQGFTAGDLFGYDSTSKQFKLDFSALDISSAGGVSEIFTHILKGDSFTFEGYTIDPSKVTFVCSTKYDETNHGYLNFYTKYTPGS